MFLIRFSFSAIKVTADFAGKVKDNKIAVEDIQDSVEVLLMESNRKDVAKKYILYRNTYFGENKT